MAAVLDATGTVGSAKHPRKWGPLLTCRNRVTDDLTVTVRTPDGAELPAGHPSTGHSAVRVAGPPRRPVGHPTRTRRAAGAGRSRSPGRCPRPPACRCLHRRHRCHHHLRQYATGKLLRLRHPPPRHHGYAGTTALGLPRRRLRPSPLPPQPRHRHPVTNRASPKTPGSVSICASVKPSCVPWCPHPDAWSPPSATATSRPTPRSCAPSRADTAYPFSTSAGSPASAYTSTS